MRLERHEGLTAFSLQLCLLLVASLPACATADPRPAAAGSNRREVAPAAGQTPLLAGAAVEVITPDLSTGLPPVAVAGFGKGRDATGVHDDLYARALVLQAGKASVALVALDLIGFFHDDIVKIRDDVRSRYPEVGVGSILIASTHTHAGPDVIGLWSPPDRAVDAGYVGRIRTRAADAVAAAWRARRPARLSFASADIPRLVQDSRLPTVVDATALLMKVDAENGQETIATLLDFPSHPESLGRDNTLISSDYPWSARLRLEQEFGGVALFFSGDIGGLLTPLGGDMIDPETGEKLVPKTPRATEAYGREVARQVVAAWRATHGGRPSVSGSADGASGARPVPATDPTVALLVRTRAVRVPLKNAMFVRGLAEGRIWPRLLAADGTLTSEVAVLTLFVESENGAPRRHGIAGSIRLRAGGDLPRARSGRHSGSPGPRRRHPGRPAREAAPIDDVGTVPLHPRSVQRRVGVHHPPVGMGPRGALRLRPHRGAVRRDQIGRARHGPHPPRRLRRDPSLTGCRSRRAGSM